MGETNSLKRIIQVYIESMETLYNIHPHEKHKYLIERHNEFVTISNEICMLRIHNLLIRVVMHALYISTKRAAYVQCVHTISNGERMHAL